MRRKSIVNLLILLITFCSISPAVSGDHPSKEEVVQFVEEAIAFAKENGKEALFKDLMDANSRFKRGELYLYAYDFQCVVLAHGAKPALVGKNLSDMTDKNGLKLVQALRDAAAKGSGWVEYYWQNPLSKEVEHKLGYVVKLDDTCWIGSGTYLP